MDDEAYVFAPAAVPPLHQALVNDDGVGPSGSDLVDGGLHVNQAIDRPHRDPVVHGDDHRAPGFPVHDPFQTDMFADHNFLLPWLWSEAPGNKKSRGRPLRHGF